MLEDRHLPQAAAIEAYGKGGFRFADMSHRGSILCLPDGIWAWPPRTPQEIDVTSLQRLLDERANIDLVVIGTGRDIVPLPAVRTYNILFGERRRVGAALIAVD